MIGETTIKMLQVIHLKSRGTIKLQTASLKT